MFSFLGSRTRLSFGVTGRMIQFVAIGVSRVGDAHMVVISKSTVWNATELIKLCIDDN